jgi:Cupin domain
MTQTLTRAAVLHYYQRLAELSTLPFWQVPDITDPAGPPPSRPPTRCSSPARPHPSMPIPCRPCGSGSPTAGGRMIIDGDRVPMEPGDLILTPGWSWHGHVHPGGDEPVVWLDGLDVPFVMGLRAGFYRDDPHAGNPLPVRDTAGPAVSLATLGPARDRVGRHSPVRRYPWQEAYPALQRLMARAPEHSPVTRLEYRNPVPGHHRLPARGASRRARTHVSRETASSVSVVARGTGTSPAAARPSSCCPTTQQPSQRGPGIS